MYVWKHHNEIPLHNKYKLIKMRKEQLLPFLEEGEIHEDHRCLYRDTIVVL
jgi:hypothetical protein